MLPHHHFAISAAATIPVALLTQQPTTAAGLVTWAAAGGIVSALMDLDVVVLLNLRARSEPALRPFRDPRRIFTGFDELMDLLSSTGVLRVALVTHLLSG